MEKKKWNLKDGAAYSLECLGKTFADVKWWGIQDKESWPLDKMETYLDVDHDAHNPEENFRDDMVLVGDGFYICWHAEYGCWGLYQDPKEPEVKNDQPWIWEREKDE